MKSSDDTGDCGKITPNVEGPTKRTAENANLSDALSDLKKSAFYEKLSSAELAKPGTSKLIRNAVAKANPLLVNPKQRGNPLLKHISNVPWEYEEIIPDYVMGRTTCALFLSLKYHVLNPDYIHERLKLLAQQYELRVLLVQVDFADIHPLKYLTRVCILANLTLMLAWSPEEAGHIIEIYKIYEQKPPDLIMEKPGSSPYEKLISALTSIRSINRTDAAILLSSFGTLKKILAASEDALTLCHGLGPKKATRLYKVLHQPFLKEKRKI